MVQLAFIFHCLLLANSPDNEGMSGKVLRVIDGNSLEVLSDGNEAYNIQLVGIDCPEIGQAFGEQAKEHLEKLVLNKTVTIYLKGKDRKGNHLAVVYARKETDVRIELLRQGLAWTAERNPDPDLEVHRKTAEEKQKGLWSSAERIPPWIYRRQQSMMQAKGS